MTETIQNNTALLDVKAVAVRLSVSVRTVWRMRDTGALPAPVRVAGCVRWRAVDIDAWIEQGCPSCRNTAR